MSDERGAGTELISLGTDHPVWDRFFQVFPLVVVGSKEPDGSFELFVGGSQREPNWLPTTSGSRKLFIRQVFDRWDEAPARLRIERVDLASQTVR